MVDTDVSVTGLDSTEPPSAVCTPERAVPAIEYTDLRLLAECAAGEVPEPVEYVFFPGPQGQTILERAARGADPGPGEVVVPTGGAGRCPRNRLELQVAPDTWLAAAPAGQVDALFWSDAAVHKFLIPYLASCAGNRAKEVVTNVHDAWNGYPSALVTVYALVHVHGVRPRTPLHLEDALLVAFTRVGEDTLDLLPVRGFLDKFPPEPSPNPVRAEQEVEYHRGGPGRAPQRPGYVQLRALAEWAASIRDKAGYFVFRAGEDGFHALHETLPAVGSGDIVIPVFTPAVPAGRPGLGGVWFTPENATAPANLADQGDALFWSTGAIEQFVFPYYASKGGLQALPDLTDLVNVWTEGRGAGGRGRPADRSGAAAGAMEEPSGDEAVAGIIHLPTSEWTEVTEEGEAMPVTRVDPARQLGVVTVDAAGGTHKHRLHEFIARRRGR